MLNQIQAKINLKTKPPGSLGQLEQIAEKICLVQNTLTPSLNQPSILVFAADHGIARDGVSAYPPEVTAQMVHNFLSGGAAINVFCAQNNIRLKVVDAGVNFDFARNDNLLNAKIAKGSRSFLRENAMTGAELNSCFEKASDLLREVHQSGCNIIGFGEMGIGNTSSASMLMSSLCRIPIEDCVGRGTGLNESLLAHKIHTLKQAQENHRSPGNASQALQYFGGFEIAQICGAMLAAYKLNMLIMVDGFIASSAFLCAYEINPKVVNNAIFCHQSDEQGHQKMLDYLKVRPILNLDLRLGEGTGCALALPLIQSAVNFLNQMASFEEAGVTTKS